MMDTAALRGGFNAQNHISYTTPHQGLVFAEIKGPQASAVVSLYGGQLLSYKPNGADEVLWVSNKSYFAPGKAIRGGIPVCWPWFGPHPVDRGMSQHGLARTAVWSPVSAQMSDGVVELRLALDQDDQRTRLWPYPTDASLTIRVGASLEVMLETRNRHPSPVVISAGLHSYFSVGDIGSVEIDGLDGVVYIDSARGKAIKIQKGPLLIAGEVDFDFLDTSHECRIHDPSRRRTIHVAKTGSKATVVWNPWIEKAKALKDMDDAEYRSMVCVESVNAFTDCVAVEPGKSHILGTTIHVSPR